MTSAFIGERVTLDRTISIDATPDAVFPLLCPVREGEWIDGWIGRSLFSESGVAEENGVYATKHEGEQETIWYVTRRDPAAHEIEFVYFVPAIQVARLYVSVRTADPAGSTISVRYIRTGITEAGNEIVARAPGQFEAMMTTWETTLNHYLRTGELMKRSH